MKIDVNEPWMIKGFAGQHDEDGALIVDKNGNAVASTSGGLRANSSPEEWTRYKFIAELIARAPAMADALIAARHALVPMYGGMPDEAPLMRQIDAALGDAR